MNIYKILLAICVIGMFVIPIGTAEEQNETNATDTNVTATPTETMIGGDTPTETVPVETTVEETVPVETTVEETVPAETYEPFPVKTEEEPIPAETPEKTPGFGIISSALMITSMVYILKRR